MGRDAEFPLTPELEGNLAKLLAAVNIFRAAYGIPMIVSSGYRPGHFNTDAGGAGNSAHKTCEACDFHDSDGKLKAFAKENIPLLEQAGLYVEDFKSTPTWIHLQIRPTMYRFFKP